MLKVEASKDLKTIESLTLVGKLGIIPGKLKELLYLYSLTFLNKSPYHSLPDPSADSHASSIFTFSSSKTPY